MSTSKFSKDMDSLKAFSEATQKKVEKAKKEVERLQKEVAEMQHGIYDKPIAPEMQEIFAWAAYLLSASTTEASYLAKIPDGQIRHLVKHKGWEYDRIEHYDRVKQKMKEYMEDEVVDKQASIAAMLWNRAEELITTTLEADSHMSPLEQAKAVEIFIKTAMDVQGGTEKKEESGIKQLAQNLLITFNQQQQLESRRVPLEVIHAEFDEDERIEAELLVLEESVDGEEEEEYELEDDYEEENQEEKYQGEEDK